MYTDNYVTHIFFFKKLTYYNNYQVLLDIYTIVNTFTRTTYIQTNRIIVSLYLKPDVY